MEILYLCGFHSTIANSPKADQIQSRPSGENVVENLVND